MKYLVRIVGDDKYGRDYEVEAFNPTHAVRQALDGYTGLFGDSDELQKNLAVAVIPADRQVALPWGEWGDET